MSGLEVIGGISAVIGIIDGCTKIYDSAQKDLKLSKTFEVVARRLPILSNTLTTVRSHLEARQGSLTPDVCQALEDTLDTCEEKARKLREIFEKVITTEGDGWQKRYAKAIRTVGKGSKVEGLLQAITEDVQNIVNNQVVQPVQQEQNQQLDDLLQELKSLESSLPDESVASTSITNYGGKQVNNTGDGQQFVIDTMSGTQNFNFVIRQKTFDFEKTFGMQSLKHLETTLRQQSVNRTVQTPTLDLAQPLFTVPLSKDPSFTGRSDILDKLSEGYKNHRRMAITGWAGVGKTQIAVEFCHRLSSSKPRPHIIWIRAETKEAFVQSYAKLAEQLDLDGWDDPKQDTNDIVCQCLTTHTSRSWFMVLDNVDNTEIFEEADEEQDPNRSARKVLAAYLPDVAHVSILVTSRNSAAALGLINEPSCVLNVPVMSQDEAIALLSTKLPNDRSRVEDKVLLVQELHCLPLAITQAAAYIFKRRYKDVTRYIKQLEADADRVLNEASVDLRRGFSSSSQGHASNSALRTWSISFDYIKQHNEKAAQLLCLLSLLQGQNFPSDVLKDETKDYDFEYEDMVQPLVDFALVTEEESHGEFSLDTISLHKLVQLSVQNWLRTTNNLEINEEHALITISAKFPDPDESSKRKIGEHLVPHAHAVLQYDFSGRQQEERCATLYAWCAILLRQRGRYNEAMLDWKHALSISERSLEKDHPLLRISLTWVILSYLDQGMFDAAEEYARKALDASMQELGESHVLSIRLMLSLAETLAQNGKFFEAKTWAERYLSHAPSKFGTSSAIVWLGKNILATILNGRGQYRQAEQLLRELASGISREVVPEQFVSTNLELSGCLISQGKAAEAKTILFDIIATTTRILGPDYHKLTIARGNLAIAYHMSGDSELAVQTCDAILPDLIAQHGPTHYMVLKVQEIQIITFRSYQDPMEPVKKLEALREIQRTTLKLRDTHPNCLLTSLNVSAAMAVAGLHMEALNMVKTLLAQMTEVLGEDHYYTQLGSAHLANFYWVTDDLICAENMSKKTIERAERSFGKYHIAVTDARNVLVKVYCQQGRIDEAKTLCKETLQIVGSMCLEDGVQIIETQKTYLTVLMYDPKELQAAKELITKILATNTRKHGKFYSGLREELLMLTTIHSKLNEQDAAEQIAKQYVSDFREHFGRSDVRIIPALTLLHEVVTANAETSSQTFVSETEDQRMNTEFRRLFEIELETSQKRKYTQREMEAFFLALEIYEIQAKVLNPTDQRIRKAKERVASTLNLINAYGAALKMRRDIMSKFENLTEFEKTVIMSKVADSLRLNQEHNEAANMFEELCQLQKKLLGENHLSVWRTMNELALCRHDLDQYQAAEVLWLQLLELKKAVYTPDSVEILLTYNNLAFELVEFGRYNEALEMMKRVIDGRSQILGDQDPATLAARHNYTYMLKRRGDETMDQNLLAAAEAMTRQVLQSRQTVLGSYHADTLLSLERLTEILSSLQKYDEAEQMCSDLIEGRLKRFGPSSKTTLASYRLRNKILHRQSKHQDVANESEALISMYTKALGPDHPDTCQILYETGHSMFLTGQHDQGEKMVREAYDALLNHPSASYFSKSDCWFKLTDLLEKRNKFKDLENVTREAMAKIAPDPKMERVPFFRIKLAMALQRLGRGREAVDTLIEDFSHRDEVHDGLFYPSKDSPAYHCFQFATVCNEEGRVRPEANKVLQRYYAILIERGNEVSYNALLSIARLYMNVGDEQAESVFRECSSMALRLYGTASSSHREVELELGSHLYLRGRYVESKALASQCYEDLRDLHKLADSDQKILRVQNDLAMATAACGQATEGKEILSHVVKLGEETRGNNAPDVMVWQANLGSMLRLCGDFEQSQQILSSNLSCREAALGKTSPPVNRTRRHLAETYIELGQYSEAEELLNQIPKVEDLTKHLIGPLITSLESEYLRGKLELLKGGANAEEILTNAVTKHVEILGAHHVHVQTVKVELAKAYLKHDDAGKREEAWTLLQDVIAVLQEAGLSECATAVAAKQVLESLDASSAESTTI